MPVRAGYGMYSQLRRRAYGRIERGVHGYSHGAIRVCELYIISIIKHDVVGMEEYIVLQRQVHPHIAAGVVVSALCTALFVLVNMSTQFSFIYDGRLAYISEGMLVNCGWSGAILGSTGGIISIAQLVVAIHVNSGWSVLCSILQFVAWNFILGVHDTGWTVHYIALSIFFVATLTFHHIASHSGSYGNPFYRRLDIIAFVLVTVFLCTFVVRVLADPSVYKSCVSVSVSIEFAIFMVVLLQQLCMAYGLARCCMITLTFDTQESRYYYY